MFETLELLLRIENERIQSNSFSFWFNLLVNRIAQYTSNSLGALLRYDVKEILRMRSGKPDSPSPVSANGERGNDDRMKSMKMFTSRNIDHRCIYVGEDELRKRPEIESEKL